MPFWLKYFVASKLFSPPARPWVFHTRGYTFVGCMWGWRLDKRLRPSFPYTCVGIANAPTTITPITQKKNTTSCLFHFVLFNCIHRRAGGIDLTPVSLNC